MTCYLREASDDAGETIRNFADEILEALLDNGEASDDLLNDYPNGDSWHHECHVDKAYDLTDAAAILDELGDFEETDTGLWEGLGMKEAVSACAAYTYGNAVYSEWREKIEKIEKINEEATAIIDDYDGRIAELEDDEESEEDDPPADREADKAVLEEEKKEALRQLIAEVADTAQAVAVIEPARARIARLDRGEPLAMVPD